MRIFQFDISILFLILTSGWSDVEGAKYNIANLTSLRYSRPGNIKLGLFNSIFAPGNPLCGDKMMPSYFLSYQVMVMKTIDKINADTSILGNIKLGLEMVENCLMTIVAIGQALKFIPDIQDLERVKLKKTTEDLDMVGVIGPITSPAVIGIAPLLNLFNIPILSGTASSDALQDRTKYPNFFRVITSNSFQARVFVDLLVTFKWNYFSIVHSENDYGYNALKNLRHYARLKGICVADSIPYPDEDTDEQREFMINKLIKFSLKFPHAVIMSVYPDQMRALLEKAHSMGVENLIWIGGGASTKITFEGLNRTTFGSLMVTYHSVLPEEVVAMLRDETAVENQDNPFFQTMWKNAFACDIANAKKDDPCLSKTLGELPGFTVRRMVMFYRDMVNVYAQAIDKLVRDLCPLKLLDPTSNPDCITPDRVTSYLPEVVLTSEYGNRRFDEKGEMMIDYEISQKQNIMESVGIWRYSTERVQWTKSLKWPYNEAPSSICAEPCKSGEFYIQGELPCCWECHRCRDNEYVANNATTCITCPYLSWPDEITFTTCVTIPLSYMQWTDMYSLGLSLISGVGLITTMAIIGMVVKYNQRKVIKGASIPMISIILTGILLVFIDVMLLIAKPTSLICKISRISFSLSCTLIFVPLLLKTHRVYLVFAASSKFTKVNPIGKSSAQYMLVVFLVGIQVTILTMSAIYWPIEAARSMPVSTEKYVELHCEQNQMGLLVPLSYNLFLLFLCTIIAFMTRKLPDNFNESWYIFLSVSTTLFVWVAFLPTYYAAFYAYHKAALLSLALALSGAVTSLCMFGPKIYALFYIDEKDIKITDFNNHTFENPSK